MNENKIKLIAFDYDGTLAQTNSLVSESEKQELKKLGEKGIVRVIATGRSLFSADEVMPPDLPFDYLVFSSGVGVMEWKTRKIIHYNSLKADKAKKLSKWLISNEHDFMLHHPVPDNHNFYFFESGRNNPDFFRRIERYKKYAIPFKNLKEFKDVSQLLIVAEKYGSEWINKLKNEFSDLNIVRTTSPLDHKTMWIEIFPGNVSKASGIKFLAEKFGIQSNKIVTIGNDFNDLDMLSYFEHSFVVKNAPDELKRKFKCLDCSGGTVVKELRESLTKGSI